MILSTDPASIIRFTVEASNMEHEGLNWSYSRSSVALWMALQSIKLAVEKVKMSYVLLKAVHVNVLCF